MVNSQHCVSLNKYFIINNFLDCEDRFLRKITQFEPNGVNVDLSKVLTYFKVSSK